MRTSVGGITESQQKSRSGVLLPVDHPMLVRGSRLKTPPAVALQHCFPFTMNELLAVHGGGAEPYRLSPTERVIMKEVEIEEKKKILVPDSIEFQLPYERLQAILGRSATTTTEDLEFDFEFETILLCNAMVHNSDDVKCILVPTTMYKDQSIPWCNCPDADGSTLISFSGTDRTALKHCSGQICGVKGDGITRVTSSETNAICFRQTFDSAERTLVSVLSEWNGKQLSKDWEDITVSMYENPEEKKKIQEGIKPKAMGMSGHVHGAEETGEMLNMEVTGVHANNLLSFLWYNHEGVTKCCTTTSNAGPLQNERVHAKDRLELWRKGLAIERKLANLTKGVWFRIVLTGDIPWHRIRGEGRLSETKKKGEVLQGSGSRFPVGLNRLNVLNQLFKVEFVVQLSGYELKRVFHDRVE